MKRQLYAGRDFRRALNIEELRALAKKRIPNFLFEYIDSGAEEERTLTQNRTAFERYAFVPDALADIGTRDLRVQLLGKPSASPLIVAPTGYNGMVTQDADILLAKAAVAAGIPFTLSFASTVPLERVAREAGGRLWMQLYMLKDRRITEQLLQRAAGNGYEALVVTTDAKLYGNREWDRRSYARPMVLNLRNRVDSALHWRWLWDVMVPHGAPRFGNISDYLPVSQKSARHGAHFINAQMDASTTWHDIRWLREQWRGKLLVKGILRGADALQAASLGCDGIVVSNHGGRQLDGAVATIDVLGTIVEAVQGRLEVFVDSGFRRGSDVVKALALGAQGVMIGRPTLYGLAAAREPGAAHALGIMHGEIDRVLGLLGCSSFAALRRDMLVRA